MKVYITKYAIANGIIEKEAEQIDEDQIIVEQTGYKYYFKPDWHLTRFDAIVRADEMRNERIEGLKKKIKVLEYITF